MNLDLHFQMSSSGRQRLSPFLVKWTLGLRHSVGLFPRASACVKPSSSEAKLQGSEALGSCLLVYFALGYVVVLFC